MNERLVIGSGPRRSVPWRRMVVWGSVGVLLTVGLARLFFIELVRVRGNTMAPVVLDGDVLLVTSVGRPDRGDVVLLEAGERSVLRRVIGLPGERLAGVEDQLTLDDIALETRPQGAFAYFSPDREQRFQQRMFREWLPDGRSHLVLGDHDGAARPWMFEAPELEVPPGHLFVMCDNRRTCLLDEMAGVVPVDAVTGVARTLVWYGEARAQSPEGSRYGALTGLASTSGPSVDGPAEVADAGVESAPPSVDAGLGASDAGAGRDGETEAAPATSADAGETDTASPRK